MNVRTRLAAVAVAGVVGAGVVGAAVAQESETPPSSSGPTAGAEQTRRDAFVAALAEELGLPEERVAEAIETVREEMVAEMRAHHRERFAERLADAVADGQLTQEQADAILAAFDAGVVLDGGHGHPFRHGFGPHGRGFGRGHFDGPLGPPGRWRGEAEFDIEEHDDLDEPEPDPTSDPS